MPQERDVLNYEDHLLDKTELIDSEVGPQWMQQYGTDDKKIAKHRKGRQEAIRDLMADQDHHHKFNVCIEKIKKIDVTDRTATVAINKWAKAAELHLKALGKYLPNVKEVEIGLTQEAEDAAKGISRLNEFLGEAIASGLKSHDERVVQERSVVSTQVHTEEEGH